MVEQLRAEVPNQLFARISLQPPDYESLETRRERKSKQKGHCEPKVSRTAHSVREEMPNNLGQRFLAQNTVNRNFNRQRVEQSQGQ